MRSGCYSLEMIQHGCQTSNTSPTHNADAHILHAVNEGCPARAKGLLRHPAMPPVLVVSGLYCKRKEKKRLRLLASFQSEAKCYIGLPRLYCKISITSIASMFVMLSTIRCCKPPCSMQARPLSLNSIHCNPCRPWQFTVAGGDAYVRVYDRRKAEAASCSGEEEQGDAAASTRSFAAALATPVSSSACRHTDS